MVAVQTSTRDLRFAPDLLLTRPQCTGSCDSPPATTNIGSSNGLQMPLGVPFIFTAFAAAIAS
jgi:hypothetical protein